MRSALPKPLHPVCGAPIIDHVLDALCGVGFDGPIVVVSPAAALAAHLQGHAPLAVQDRPSGTGDALAAAESHVHPDTAHLLVINGDAPLVSPESLASLMAAHEASGARMTLLTARGPLQSGLGRVIRDGDGSVSAIVEERDATPEQMSVDEVNGGVYALRTEGLWHALSLIQPAPNGELYLTALADVSRDGADAVDAVTVEDAAEVIGVNTREDLALAESVMRTRIRERWMRDGVTLVDPAATYIDSGVLIGHDTVVHPNTHLQGNTRIGNNCTIGPNAVVRDSVIGDGCTVIASMLEESTLEPGADVGPFSHLRPGAHIGRGTHIGNFVEIKASELGSGVKAGHFSYIGDARVGDEVNIGAGTVTANYDGVDKHTTVIEEGALVGSDTIFVAPVRAGKGSRTGAGSVVTHDVADGDTVVGVPARPIRNRKASPGGANKGKQ